MTKHWMTQDRKIYERIQTNLLGTFVRGLHNSKMSHDSGWFEAIWHEENNESESQNIFRLSENEENRALLCHVVAIDLVFSLVTKAARA